MSELPYPISGKDITTALQQMQRLMDDLYQERVAGAILGDVFEVGADDILSVKLSAAGGLQKVSNALAVLVDPLDALKSTTAGLGINNATATKHGALPILSDIANQFLNGKGLWIEALSAALYDANTIIKADTDDTPVALTVGEQTLIGRITGGVIAALSSSQVRTLLGLATTDSPVFAKVLVPEVKTDTTAPTDLTVACGADKTLVLSETVWDDLPPVPIIGAKLGSSAPTLATFVGNVEQYTFDATNDYVIGATEITHKWKEGTVIYPHIHWATNGTNANDRGVKWSLEYTIGDSAETFAGAATTTVDVTIPLATADRTHLISNFDTTINGANYRIGAYICWKLSRIATAHANGAPANDPFALAIGFHAEMERIGSRTMTAA